jgi:2-oxoglutarate ferredoxin oxidoreductase subunit alpha
VACSSFQVHFADRDIVTPGEDLDVLVAMNPAALKVHLPSLRRGGVLITDSSEYTKRNLNHAGYAVSPLDDGSLEASYQLVRLDLNSVTGECGGAVRTGPQGRLPARNMFALGLVSWLYSRDMDAHPGVAAAEVRGPARGSRRQPGRLGGRLELRREHRDLRGAHEVASILPGPRTLPPDLR